MANLHEKSPPTPQPPNPNKKKTLNIWYYSVPVL